MDIELILQVASEVGSLKIDGPDGSSDYYDSAIIGITDDGVLVYGKELVLKCLHESGEMDYDEAMEFLEYNTFNTYAGDMTPIFINQYL